MKSDKENLSVDERIGQNLKAYRKLIGLERKEMADKGRKEIKEKYSYSLLAKQYMKIFEEVMK